MLDLAMLRAERLRRTLQAVSAAHPFYRARFAGLEKSQAEATCKQLKRNDISCMTLKN